MVKKRMGLWRRLLGQSFTRALSARRLMRRFHPPMINFPADLSAVTSLLIVMPDDPIDALHRIPLCVALRTRFKDAAVTVLTTAAVGPYLKGLQELVRIEEYDGAGRYIGSKLIWPKASWLFAQHFSMTLLLERNPDDALLVWCGATAAPIRAGFAGSGQYPFLNMQFQGSQEHADAVNSNNFIASLFTTVIRSNFQWMVSPQTIDETRSFLHEYKIPAMLPLVGIDLDYCAGRYGTSWLEALVKRCKELPEVTLYAYSGSEPDEAAMIKLQKLAVPLIVNLPVPLLAGLLHQSALVISGKSICGELALLLHKEVICLVTAAEAADFTAAAPSCSLVMIKQKPDSATIAVIAEKATAILSQLPKVAEHKRAH
ncbi:MAG: hypothetical protein PHC61_09215 [Chitinivibrionales bacterium]|nr:hypothetical protein [Chitinivibrionales bacterium]